MLRAAAAAAVPVEAVVIIGTHGGLRAKPFTHHEPRHGEEFAFLFPVTWPDHVEICGITMPFGGNVNYANDKRETQAVDAAGRHLTTHGTFFDSNNLKLRRLADALLSSDIYLPDACVHGSRNQFSAPKIHDGATLESDYDNEVSDTMEGVTGFDVVKGCVVSDRMDPRQIIANYVPLVYSNTGIIDPPPASGPSGPTKVPLCSKVFTLSTEEYDEGRGRNPNPEKRPKAEWKVTLLTKNPDGTVTNDDQFVEQLLRVPPPPDVFGTDSHHLRADEHSKAFYTETLITHLVAKGFTKITIVDVTCCVFRNSGPYRAAGYPFGSVCEGGMTHETRTALHRTVTPWISLSRFGILETYDNPHLRAEKDGYYHDRFRNATHSAVNALIIKYYDYLQLIYECKKAALDKFVSDKSRSESKTIEVVFKDTNPATKTACIQAFFDLYKVRCLDKRGTAIEKPKTSSKGGGFRTPLSCSKNPDFGKSHKTRHGKRHKSRNFRNKSRSRFRSRSRSRRTRRRVIKRKNN